MDTDKLESRLSALEQENYKQAERIALLEKDNKSMWKRIDEQTKLIQEVRELAISVRMMAERLDETRAEVKELKARPSLHWDRATAAMITAVVGGIVAYVLFNVGLRI